MLMLCFLINASMSSLLSLSAACGLLAAFRLGEAKQAVVLSWELGQLGPLPLELPLMLDPGGSLFMFSVCAISAAVLVFSRAYMASEVFFLRFHLLVMAFVASMLILIVSPNLISLLLGWDGLGVTSYLLVVYFQSPKAYNAGMLTILTNRLGDVAILCCIAALLAEGSWNFILHSLSADFMVKILPPLVIVAAMTKSAQVPFSAWLPAAMAAPTPVSSLVHSSTLVTAGVFLLVRFSGALGYLGAATAMGALGVITMMMAGGSAMFEMDMKKIVALSTLSQLGLMVATLGLGLPGLALFHLLTHAYFKALLFMSVGNLIHLSSDYQDLRKLSVCSKGCSLTLAFSSLANLSLCGWPFLGGFYSKDMVLECSLTSPVGPWLIALFFTATALTASYSARFLYLICSAFLKKHALTFESDFSPYMYTSMGMLWPLAVLGGSGLLWALSPHSPALMLPLELKNLTLSCVMLGASMGPLAIAGRPSASLVMPLNSWGSMWSLVYISGPPLTNCTLALSHFSRWVDLSWAPYATLSSPRGAARVTFTEAATGLPSFSVSTLALGALSAALIFSYMCT